VFTPEPNPFEVLRLDPAASEEEVVRRAGQLRRRAADEGAVAELRRAVQALTGRAEERQLLALLSHPRPGYSAPALERLAAEFRRAPTAEIPPKPFPLDLAEFAELIGGRLAAELEAPPSEFEPLAADDDSDEIRRQSDEARWLSLVFDTRL
jgi:hypothetical protein